MSTCKDCKHFKEPDECAVWIHRKHFENEADKCTTFFDKTATPQVPVGLGPGEVQKADSDTGAKKGVKLPKGSLIPPRFILALAEHLGRGAQKYDTRNWEKGYNWSLSYDALIRHLMAFWSGEEFDTEEGPMKGAPHIIAVAWHCMVLYEFMHTHREKDDRPYTKKEDTNGK